MFIAYYFKDFDSQIPGFPVLIPRGMIFNSPCPEEWKNNITRFPDSPRNEKYQGIDSPNNMQTFPINASYWKLLLSSLLSLIKAKRFYPKIPGYFFQLEIDCIDICSYIQLLSLLFCLYCYTKTSWLSSRSCPLLENPLLTQILANNMFSGPPETSLGHLFPQVN